MSLFERHFFSKKQWGYTNFQKVDVVLPENPHISELRRSWADHRSIGQTLIHARSTLELFLGQSGRGKCPN